MNKYENRWRNALKVANNVNRFIDDGYIVLDENNQIVPRISIDDEMIWLQYGVSSFIIFQKDTELDHGMHTTIPEFNNRFKLWTICKKIDTNDIFK